MNLFGKKKAAPAPAVNPADTIVVLRQQLEMLEKREAHIQKKIDTSVAEARAKAAKKDKKGALFCLKRKKMYEGEISKLQGARVTLECQSLALESAAVNIETFRAVEGGAKAMKSLRGNIDADRVDQMMDDMEEEKDVADQISEAISRPAQDMFDDEDLLNELAELEELEMEESLLAAPAAPTMAAPAVPTNTVFTMPSVPTNMPVRPVAAANESEDEAALRELQASMMA